MWILLATCPTFFVPTALFDPLTITSAEVSLSLTSQTSPPLTLLSIFPSILYLSVFTQLKSFTESTAIALLAKLSNLLDPLRDFVAQKPVWGTCAGAILLSRAVVGAKKGGQELLGGMSVRIARNGFGSQVESFETELDVDGLREKEIPFKGVFIRAPVVLELTPTPTDPPIEIVARLSPNLVPHLSPSPDSEGKEGKVSEEAETYVALRQGAHLLTTFHPELTNDARFHEYFVRECVVPQLGRS